MAKSQSLISKDGISIDIGATAEEAKKNVDRHNDMPIHACGLISNRDCPCWTCTKNDCAACMASMI